MTITFEFFDQNTDQIVEFVSAVPEGVEVCPRYDCEGGRVWSDETFTVVDCPTCKGTEFVKFAD